MPQLYRIEHTGNGEIKVITPYNPEFVSDLKTTFGTRSRRWEDNGWILPPQYEDEVRTLMRKHYGCDDRLTPMATIEIEAKQEIRADRGPVIAYGRIIASASGKSSGAFAGDYVAILGQTEDGIRSEGTTRYWQTVIQKGTRFKVLHVTKSLVVPENTEEEKFSLISVEDEKPDADALKREYHSLVRRALAIEKEAEKIGMSKKELRA